MAIQKEIKEKIQEVKTYKCSDGEIFETRTAAELHERDIADPEYVIEKRIKELEKKVLELEVENAALSTRIATLEATKSGTSYPWSKPNPDVSPWGPYQNPQNPMAPTPKLPAQPGDVVFEDKDRYQRVIMQEDGSMKVTHTAEDDERAIKDGKTVIYAGHNRVVMDKLLENPLYNGAD